jgi:hypothetical protein
LRRLCADTLADVAEIVTRGVGYARPIADVASPAAATARCSACHTGRTCAW